MNLKFSLNRLETLWIFCLALCSACGASSVSVSGQTGDDRANASRETGCAVCEHGQCINRQCMCEWGFAGPGCNTCAPGHSGPSCREGNADVAENAPAAPVPAADIPAVVAGPYLVDNAGVAPFGVFVDAAAMLGMSDIEALHADVHWDFGDDKASPYATTQKPRDRATGFVAAHVYEAPGTYSIEASVVDRHGKTQRMAPVTVTVQAFKGKTRCVSTGKSFDAAPSDCEQITDTNLAPHLTWVTAGANRRLLLRRGDSFQLGTPVVLEGKGPAIVGAFGDKKAARPVLRGGDQPQALTFNTDNLRIMDLELDHGGLFLSGHKQVASNLSVHNSPRVGITVTGEQVFVTDSQIEANEYFSVYAEGARMSFTGNRIDQMRVATSFSRPPEASKDVYIAHNIIDATRDMPSTGIKWHSRRGVMTDNIMVAGISRIALSTDSGDVLSRVDEKLGMVLIERNLMRRSLGGKRPENDRTTDAGVSFNTHQHVVMRHNLMVDMSRAFVDSSGGAEPVAQHVEIYNNSIVKRTSKGLNYDEGDFLSLNGAPIDWRIFNNAIEVTEGQPYGVIKIAGKLSKADLRGLFMDYNLYYRPGQIERFVATNTETDLPHSFSAWQKAGFDGHSRFAAANYLSTDPDDRNLLKLRPDSVAVDAGQKTGAAFDGEGKVRIAGKSIDIGAFELSTNR